MNITFDQLMQFGLYNIGVIGLVFTGIMLVITLIDRNNKKK